MKYGIKSILRTPMKTIMFVLLIAAVTGTLSLGVGMWFSAESMLDEADKTFTTVGNITYIMGNYPDEYDYDPSLKAFNFDINTLNRKGVLFVEPNYTQRAYINGFKPPETTMPYVDMCVLLVSITSKNPDGADLYNALADRAIYSAYNVDRTFMTLSVPEGVTLEVGKEYIVFGRQGTVQGKRFSTFNISPLSILGIDAEPEASIESVEKHGTYSAFLETEEYKFYEAIGNQLRYLNNSVNITATTNIKSISQFHNGEFTLIKGELFGKDDAGACIISERMASMLGLDVGDTMPVNIHRPAPEGLGRYMSYFIDEGFAAEDQMYKITGIYRTNTTDNTVFISYSNQSYVLPAAGSYNLGTITVNNRYAESYYEAVKNLIPPEIRFEIYDQGYAAAVVSINGMKETAFLIIIPCVIASALVLWFFGFLFVKRNEKSAKTLITLGSGSRRVMSYYLSGSVFMSLFAAFIGVAAGYFISQFLFTSVYNMINENSVYDFRYSTMGYGAMSEEFSAVPDANILSYLLTLAAVMLAAVIFCAVFAMGVIRRQNPHYRFKKHSMKKHAKTAKTQKRTSGRTLFGFLPTVPLRYSAKSIVRGGNRSLVVPLVIAVLLLFISVFHNIRSSFADRLSTVYDDISVTMRITGINGKNYDNLYIVDTLINDIADTEFVEKAYTTTLERCKFDGITAYADGTIPDPMPPYPELPTGQYSEEIYIDEFRSFSHPITATDDFMNAPELSLSGTPVINWADGYSEEDYFTGGYSYDEETEEYTFIPLSAIVPQEYMTKHGISPGDTVYFTFLYVSDYYKGIYTVEAKIIASYLSDKPNGSIYVKAGIISKSQTKYDGYWLMLENGEYEFVGDIITNQFFSSASFLLKDTRRLSELKDYLIDYFDPLGKAGTFRRWIAVDDKALYKTVDSLTRYKGYTDALYPVILALIAVIGFFVSGLLLKSRAGEMTVMREVGTSKISLFFSFFTEQFLLTAVGIAAGIGITAIAFSGLSAINTQNIALLAACYCAGTAAAIIDIYRKTLLQSKEDE